MVVRLGVEPRNPEGADLQSAVVGHLTISPRDYINSGSNAVQLYKIMVPTRGFEPRAC